MPLYLLDLELDGYEDEEERSNACEEFVLEQLDITASSVHLKKLELGEDGETPTVDQLANLWRVYKNFKDKYKPACAESIHQVDEINLACTEFVEELFESVGYYREEGGEYEE
jgi:hypothetical protein